MNNKSQTQTAIFILVLATLILTSFSFYSEQKAFKNIEKKIEEINKIPKKIVSSKNSSIPTAYEGPSLKIGDPAPRFKLKDINNNWVSLKSFYKVKQVIIFAFIPGCEDCESIFPKLEKFYRKYKGKNFEIFGVTRLTYPEEKVSVEEYIKKNKITFRILLADFNFGIEYKFQQVPMIWVINTEGKITAVYQPAEILKKDLQKLLLKGLNL